MKKNLYISMVRTWAIAECVSTFVVQAERPVRTHHLAKILGMSAMYTSNSISGEAECD